MGYILKIGDNVPSIGKNILANSNTVTTNILGVGGFVGGTAGIAFNHENNTYYVANITNSTINIVDATTDLIIKTISGFFNGPRGIAIDLVLRRYYVCNLGNNTLRIMDIDTDLSIANISLGYQPTMIKLDGVEKYFISNFYYDNFKIYDTVTNKLLFTVGSSTPYGIAIDKENNKYYVGNYNTGTVSIFNYTNNNLIGAPINVIGTPSDILLDIPNNRYYVATTTSALIRIMNYTSNSVISTISTPCYCLFKNIQGLYVSSLSTYINKISTIYS